MMDEENFNAKKASDQGYDFGNETDRDQGIHDEPITGQRGNVDIKMQKRTVVFGQSRPELGNNNIRTSKYTLLTFFPFNLFEQLIKTANIYFLVLTVMQMFPAISISQGQPTILFPLSFVIIVSMIKDFIEDRKRSKSDDEENNSPCWKYEGGKFNQAKWRDLVSGDIVKIMNNAPFPADMLMLSSENPKKDCFIMTKNLDGETNLKTREACQSIKDIVDSEKDIMKLKGSKFDIEAPNDKIEKFEGKFTLPNGKSFAVDKTNILLRGCVLRNTPSVVGLVTFVGQYTKVMQNNKPSKPKHSTLEKKMSIQIIFVFLTLVMFCIIAAIIYIVWLNKYEAVIGYIELGTVNKFKEFFIRTGNWVLIFGNFVPISLLVTLETVKFIQALFISSDEKMYTKKCDSKVIVQSSNLNEELGQISYVFSDKTGTLTCNEMIFKKCIVEGKAYGNKEVPELKDNYKEVTNVDFTDPDFLDQLQKEEMKLYCKFLSICHMIITEEAEGDDLIFNSSSPDEIALANFGKYCGHEFRGMDETGKMVIRIDGNDVEFKRHYVLEFNSDRKRQSVIFEEANGDVWIYTKGADNVMMARASTECLNRPETKKLQENLDLFAKEGLRTLVLGVKKVSKKQWKEWQPRYKEALESMQDRDKLVQDAQAEIEQDLFIIGATAIEDRLQDEVPNVIAQLKRAGIRVWVLTGDKVETAKTIGYSCNLLQDGMKNYEVIRNKRSEIQAVLNEAIEDINKDRQQGVKKNRGIIVTGAALEEIFKSENSSLRKILNAVAQECEAVLCCRVSPIQKQQIVVMVKECVPTARTLSIGDGANDVPMISAAHVGIGIKGVEGQQAARSSDYAVGQFKHLRRLVFYYGRESYRKNTVLVLYSFYKNVVLVLPQFWYAVVYGNTSGVTLYDSILYQLANVVFTALPIIVYAVLDRDASDEYLEASHQYYFPGPKNMFFNTPVFWMWFGTGAFQALMITIFCGMSNSAPQSDGVYLGFWGFGVFVFNCAVLVSNLKIFIFSSSYHFLGLLLTIGSYVMFILFFFLINIMTTNSHYGLFSRVYFNMNNILLTLLVVAVTYHVDNMWTKIQYAVFYKGSTPPPNASLKFENIKSLQNNLEEKGEKLADFEDGGNNQIGSGFNVPSHSTSSVGKQNRVAPSHQDSVNVSEIRPLGHDSVAGKLNDMKVARVPSRPTGSTRNGTRGMNFKKDPHNNPRQMKITTQKRSQNTRENASRTENSNVDLDSSYIGLNQANQFGKAVRGGYDGYEDIQGMNGFQDAADGVGRKLANGRNR